jgi:rhomboid protease GluP
VQSSGEGRPTEAFTVGARDASQRSESQLFREGPAANAPAAPLEAEASIPAPTISHADDGLAQLTCAQYLAEHLIAQKGLQPGVPPEASAIAQACDIVLSGMEGVSLKIIAIIDRDAHPGKEFALGRDALEAIGRDCLKYCGKVNRAQMPVIIQVIEVENRAPKDEQKLRLRKLRRSSRFGKVVLSGWIVDASSSTVWTNLPFNGRLMGRPFIENLLRPSRHEALPKSSALTRAPVTPFLTYALLAALIGVYVCELVFAASPMKGLDTGLQTLIALGGLSHPLVADGQWYRLLSAAFLHVNLLHLLMNGFCLVLAGTILETLVGRSWLAIIFLFGALDGSVASLLINPPNIVGVGASGAIMALFAAIFMLSFRFEGAPRMQLRIRAMNVLIPSLIPLGLSLGGGRIDYGAHLGGTIAGVLLGLMIIPLWPRDEVLPRFRIGAAFIASLGGLALAFALFSVLQTYPVFAVSLIPDDQLPKTNNEGAARATDLLARYPQDPRAHFYRAVALLQARDFPGEERELRLSLAGQELIRSLINSQFEMLIRGALAEVLAKEGKENEAKNEAKPACLATDMPAQLRSAFNKAHLCD